MVNIKDNIKKAVDYFTGKSIDDHFEAVDGFEHDLGILKTQREKNIEKREQQLYKIGKRWIPLALEIKGLYGMATGEGGQPEIVLAEMIRNDEFTEIYLRDKMSQIMDSYKKPKEN